MLNALKRITKHFSACGICSSVQWNCKRFILAARESLWDSDDVCYHPCFFIGFVIKSENKSQLFFFSFACFVIYFGSSLHTVFLYKYMCTTHTMLGLSFMYSWKYFCEYRFSTKFNNRKLLLLTNVTYIWLLFSKNFQSLL